MTKDEMKNRISMALKDPILQQGFEIICKNLSELEKENTELKDKLNNLASVAEVRLANWQKYEKENAELKAVERMALYSKMSDQLTKAKEHIQTLISCLIDWVQEGDKDYCHIAETEQFLKEVEK